MDKMRLRIEEIAIKYADLVEKRIQEALDAKMVGSAAMNEVNDGIRMLNHVAATLERIVRLQCADGPNKD